MVVMVEGIRTGIVRDIQIGPAVVVEVAPNALHAEVMLGVVHAGRFRNVLEGAIAVIVKQEIRLAGKSPRSTLLHDPAKTAKLIIAAEFRQLVDVDEYVSRRKQIDTSIPVEVAPRRPCAESADRHTGFFRHVFKPAVAKVPIEYIPAIARNIDVVPAVIVEIGHGNTHSPALACQAGFFGDLLELQIAFLAVQRNHRIAALLVVLYRRSIDGNNVKLAVVIAVDKTHSTAHGFDDVPFVG